MFVASSVAARAESGRTLLWATEETDNCCFQNKGNCCECTKQKMCSCSYVGSKSTMMGSELENVLIHSLKFNMCFKKVGSFQKIRI